jgi:C4-dicarboxylate transporter DctQ subunit
MTAHRPFGYIGGFFVFLNRKAEDVIVVFLLSVVVLCLSFSVFVRYFLSISILSAASNIAEEIAVFAFIWLVYWGAILATKNDAHFRVSVQFAWLPERLRKLLYFPGSLMWLLCNLIIVRLGWDLVRSAVGQTSICAELSMEYVYAIIPLSFFLMSFRLIQKFVRFLTRLK